MPSDYPPLPFPRRAARRARRRPADRSALRSAARSRLRRLARRPPAPPRPPPPRRRRLLPARSATDVSALYERVSPGVVSVDVATAQRRRLGLRLRARPRRLHPHQRPRRRRRADRARALRRPARRSRARVVGVDPSTDLALLKIDPAGRKLTPLALGSSKDLKVGQPAIAIGSPFRLEGTLTTGVISALGRSITAPNNFSIDNVVQTDAAINPGNSGGPLLDAGGRVVGINAQIATSTQSNSGVGFAIPIDTAKQVLPQLKRGEEIKRAYLGVETGDARTGIRRARRRRRAGRSRRRRRPAGGRPRSCRSPDAR